MRDTRLATLIFALTSMASSIGLGFLLTMKLGRRLGLRLMYCIAALPGVVLLQVWPAGRQARHGQGRSCVRGCGGAKDVLLPALLPLCPPARGTR
jgi:hypothetical protein